MNIELATKKFEAHIKKVGDCWIWTGHRDKNGCSHFWIGKFKGGQVTAERFSYVSKYGEIAPRWVLVHTCGNNNCVNPEHLRTKNPKTPKDFLEERVNKTDTCWNWTGTKADGYGVFTWRRKRFHAHRLSYELNNGPIPKGLFVCHHCDNRSCIKPDHLYAGTVYQNIKDAKDRGRVSRGESHYHAKLNENKIKEIRERIAKGEKGKLLAKEFDVNSSCISKIKHRTHWKHI